jgi:hypothetical protein
VDSLLRRQRERAEEFAFILNRLGINKQQGYSAPDAPWSSAGLYEQHKTVWHHSLEHLRDAIHVHTRTLFTMKLTEKAQHFAAQVPQSLNVWGLRNVGPGSGNFNARVGFQHRKLVEHGNPDIFNPTFDINNRVLLGQQRCKAGRKSGQGLAHESQRFSFLDCGACSRNINNPLLRPTRVRKPLYFL